MPGCLKFTLVLSLSITHPHVSATSIAHVSIQVEVKMRTVAGILHLGHLIQCVQGQYSDYNVCVVLEMS